MKIVAIIQARMGSVRLPGKVMRPICGTPMIGILLERLANAHTIDEIVIATADHQQNVPLTKYVEALGYVVYQGSENDVLERYYQSAIRSQADIIVRITGDCPLTDPLIVDKVIKKFQEVVVDYCSNLLPRSFPKGLDVEVFTFQALKATHKLSDQGAQREHVTPLMLESNIFSRTNYTYSDDWSSERWTVDEKEDIEVIENVFKHFHPRRDFGWMEVLKLRHEKPKLFSANRHLIRESV